METGSLKCEIKNINNNGETKWQAVDITKFSENRFLGFAKDITENHCCAIKKKPLIWLLFYRTTMKKMRNGS
ncbi:hypothetical protein [Flavobacterium sp. XS2P39]|uniref:hypothetical protein n=1 Tax=Flavobacterium sp. XS2P39 TaxID=3401725 RepID=UPI003AADE320